MQIFVAEIETQTTQSHAYGLTAEEAVKALVGCWKHKHAPISGADPDYLEEYREEMRVFEVTLGQGYVIGGTDLNARKIVATGDDQRFDDLFPNSFTTFKR